jgi:hypothetical protein
MQPKIDIQDLTIRMERTEDERSVIRLAQLDSAWPPAGPRLLVVAAGRPLAAISLESGRVIADPFVPSGPLVELLRARAAQLGFSPPRRGLRDRLRHLRPAPAAAAARQAGPVRPRLQRPLGPLA